MTDSGIVADSPRTSVKDALSKLDGKDLGDKKHGSLPRNMAQEDAEKGIFLLRYIKFDLENDENTRIGYFNVLAIQFPVCWQGKIQLMKAVITCV